MTADTAKCAGNGCPIRESCDRFVRPAVDRQTWMEPKWEWRVEPKHASYPARWNPCQCVDWLPAMVQPHGGAREEGDGA